MSRRADGSRLEPEEIVGQWFKAFNARDLDGMLAHMHARVEFHPLKLEGLDNAYQGHDGVRRWFAALEEMGHRHWIELSDIRDASNEQLIAIGSVSGTATPGPSSFWALERFAEGTIVAAHHYLTDPDILRESGLLEWT